MKKQKTKYIKVRMTLEEVEQFKKKAKEYKTVSHYVRRALEEYSNMNIRQQIELMNDLGTFYQKYQNELSWAGSNLNQAMKRANELSVAGLLFTGGAAAHHPGNPAHTDLDKARTGNLNAEEYQVCPTRNLR